MGILNANYEHFVILLAVSLLLMTLFLYLVVSGLLTKIKVTTGDSKYGPLVIAYKPEVGPYKQAGQLFTESYCLLPHRVQIGIYYDDPEAVAEYDLRYAVGSVLSNGEESPSKEEMDLMVSHGFQIFNIPKANFVVTTTFPFRTTVSIYVAIFRVYPKLRRYISERNLCAYPAIEIYADQEIVFIMPLSRQEEFFVPAFQDDQISVVTTDVESTLGEKDIVSKEEDQFLKPRTPTKAIHQQSFRKKPTSRKPKENIDDSKRVGNTSESEDDVSGTVLSFNGLDDLNQSF